MTLIEEITEASTKLASYTTERNESEHPLNVFEMSQVFGLILILAEAVRLLANRRVCGLRLAPSAESQSKAATLMGAYYFFEKTSMQTWEASKAAKSSTESSKDEA